MDDTFGSKRSVFGTYAFTRQDQTLTLETRPHDLNVWTIFSLIQKPFSLALEFGLKLKLERKNHLNWVEEIVVGKETSSLKKVTLINFRAGSAKIS